MIRVTCDGCDKPIDRDADRWLGVDLNEPLSHPISPDPVEAMNDAEGNLVATLKVGFGGDHEFHFCSAPCLSAWAFAKGLDTP